MRTPTFILLAALLASVALCQVQETARRTRLQYRLARAQRQEGRLRRQVEDLLAEEMRLTRPPRLMALNGRLPVPLEPLRPWTRP